MVQQKLQGQSQVQWRTWKKQEDWRDERRRHVENFSEEKPRTSTERQLWANVLVRTMDDLLNPKTSRAAEERRADARRFLVTDASDLAFTTLGIDPQVAVPKLLTITYEQWSKIETDFVPRFVSLEDAEEEGSYV
jgi:hypothetical protein